MKTKKFSKKLTLNKRTVSDLNGNELKKVKGGIPTFPIPGCPIYVIETSNGGMVCACPTPTEPGC